MAGKYAIFWQHLKEHRTLTLIVDTQSVKTVKKLISREKEKDIGWALAGKECNNDSWIIKSAVEQLPEARSKIVLSLKRRPFSF